MATHSFTTANGRFAKFNSGGKWYSPPSDQVCINLDENSTFIELVPVTVGLFPKTTMKSTDTINIDNIAYTSGIPALFDTIIPLFPKGNSGSASSSNVEGLDLYLYSHSYGVLQSPANCSPNRLYQKLIFNRLNFGSLNTRSNNGYFAQDVAAVMMNITAFTPGNTGVTIIDCAQNDLRVGTVGGVLQTANLNGFKNSLRAMLWYLRCSTIKQETDASFTYTGTWSTLTQTWFMGGTMKTSNVLNDQVDIAVTGTDFVLFTRGTTSAASVASIYVDGVLKATVDNTAGDQGKASTSSLASSTVPIAVPLLGLGAGNHTITVKKTSGASLGIYVDTIGTITTTPPQVLVHKQVYLPDAAYTTWANGATNATVDVMNAAIDAVIAEFPNDGSIKAVNMNANGWDRTTMLGSVNTGHPNDRGMVKIADTAIATLLSLPYRAGMNVL